MRRIALFGMLILALPAFLPASAQAQATRTWVSGVGDDANPCSRTAPCKTFAGAISKTAPAGEIDCLDPGGFGALTITKSITIDCTAGRGGGVLVSSTNGFVINAGTGAVTLRYLNFQGLAGPGSPGTPGQSAIKVLSAGSVLIEHVNTTGFGSSTSPAINVVPTCSPAGNVMVDIEDTTVNNNLDGAILISPGTGCTLFGSLTRVNMHSSLYGLKVTDNAKVTVFHSVASNTTQNAFLAASTSNTAQIYLSNSVAANSATGVASTGAGGAMGGAIVNLDNVTVVGNTTGVAPSSGGLITGSTPGTTLNVGNNSPGGPNGGNATLQ